ncbi:signal peptidase I [Paenibacillus eucommiae]|uniref:Signal peptidase I n=1 Tax=Paenibacillus eucommiae TaxID=1355755 RepID=A0ABS4IWX0_9BACL|nr:signal peptidase I [Paenibacillus eucommiae]MBP1991361.1 signal peptidase I [Paenibacillus eucommiae]
MEHSDPKEPYINTSDAGAADKSKTVKNEVWEWAKALLIAGVLVFVIRWFVFAPFIVEGPSMEPNFYTSERLIVNKILYDIRKPKRGEVVVFHAPEGKDYIKRVVALPGETVKVEGDKIYINGQEIEQTYLKEALEQAAKEGRSYNTLANFPETTVPEGSIFAMGDNRSNSRDSRDPSVGFVPYKEIVGRADLIFWPMSKISLVHFK